MRLINYILAVGFVLTIDALLILLTVETVSALASRVRVEPNNVVHMGGRI